ncbi:MAG: twin-arginine translocation signal domain-containing protein, partial [Rhodocyclaceae bacterium]|nr:twin-arginine translocation signal domain-containing protein [Rhodocyclaceae bacterium]
MSNDDQNKQLSRRSFLSKAAAGTAGAAALGFPMISVAQSPITMRWQSTWPAKDIFHEYAQDFASRVNGMSGGRLKIEVLPAGAVVKAFDLLDAVSKGTLDGGHGVVAYWYGKNSAVALWGSGPAFGMDPNMVLAWHNYGGGKQMLDDIYKSLNLDVQSFIYGPMPTQPFGWFKKPVTKVADIKGMKFRTVGLAVYIYKDMGVALNPMPGGEIVTAIDRGLIDGA